MKLARYMGSGVVEIVDEPIPVCPEGGLLVRTEASGLCSGELMDWYMDRKIPHVLGHEVAGTVVESQDERFPVGSRVFPHHHAPCLKCELCQKGLHVHCPQWKRTKLIPGGMAEYFGVPAENLNDTLLIGEVRAQDAALIEPLACVIKSLSSIGFQPMSTSTFQVESPNIQSSETEQEQPIQKRQGANLPHWTKTGATYFVTFRLADSVPVEAQEEWIEERKRIEQAYTRDRVSAADKFKYLRLHSEKVETFLDAGIGSCCLQQPECAQIVADTLKHFDGERYDLLAWCVMPNHVHAVVSPKGKWELAQILHSWKSFSANKINSETGRNGPLWQPESYDHLIRNEDDLARCVNYVKDNPAKAGLLNWDWVGWKESPGGKNQDLEGLGTHRLEADATAVIGLGVMGLMHALLLPGCVGFDLNSERVSWAVGLGLDARLVGQDLAGLETHEQAAHATFDSIFVCPGSQGAFDLALRLAAPGATIVMFAPLGPGEDLRVPQEAYFKDLRIVNSYSCGPDDTRIAKSILEAGEVRAEQVVSHFISLDELPSAYRQMKSGEILKPMVLFNQ